MKLDKKGGSFTVYAWFALVCFIILMITALISLFVNLSSVQKLQLAKTSDTVFKTISQKEMAIAIITQEAGISAQSAALDLAEDTYKIGGDAYFNAYIVSSETSTSSIQKKTNAQFPILFVDRLNNGIKANELEYEFDSQYVSALGENVLGYSTETLNLRGYTNYIDNYRWFISLRPLPLPKIPMPVSWSWEAVTSTATLSFYPNFNYKFQNYSLNDYVNVIGFIKKDVIPKFVECNSASNKKSCIYGKTVEINKNQDLFDIRERDRCINWYNKWSSYQTNYADSYSIPPEDLIYYDFSSKFKKCIESEKSKVICMIEVDVPLSLAGYYVIEDAVTYSSNVISINSLIDTSKKTIINGKKLYVSDDMKENAKSVRFAILNDKEDQYKRTVTVISYDESGDRVEITGDTRFYVIKEDDNVAFISGDEYNQILIDASKNGFTIMRSSTLVNDINYICIIDKSRQIMAKVDKSYKLVNPVYNFAVNSGKPTKQQDEDEYVSNYVRPEDESTSETGTSITLTTDEQALAAKIDAFINPYFEEYLNREKAALPDGSKLKGKDIVEASNKYDVPIALILAQGHLETGFLTWEKSITARKCVSPFGVGIWVNSPDCHANSGKPYSSARIAVLDYARILKENYLVSGKTVDDLLATNGYVNKNGERYAEDLGYEAKVKTQYDKMVSMLTATA